MRAIVLTLANLFKVPNQTTLQTLPEAHAVGPIILDDVRWP